MKISIIIPVYNVEKHLKKCLDSVLLQSFTDFETILINDGSTDRSGRICEEYAAKHKCFKVFHIPNGGVSAARNLGLLKSSGEFICFIDSDDSVERKYLSDLISSIVDEHVDLVIQGFTSISKSRQRKIAFGENFVSAENHKMLFEVIEIFKYGYPFSKLFRAEIIKRNEIIFPENYSFAEDLSFFLIYLSKCRYIKFDERYNYNYVSQPNSLSKTIKETSEYLNRYADYKELLKKYFPDVFFEAYNNGVCFEEFTRSIGGSIFYYIQSLYLNKLQSKLRIEHLKSLQKDDLVLMRNFKRHLNHPMYKFAFYLITKKKFSLADIILKIFI